MITTKCLCGEYDAIFLFYAGSYRIVRCVTCGQVRTETPKGVKRTQFYDEDNISIYIEKEEMFRKIFRQKLAFIKQFRESGKLLDIGAGVGLFVDEARRAGFDAQGMEPSNSAVFTAKKNFNISLTNKEFNSSDIKSSASIILINHVLEHMIDPREIILHVQRVLEPTGVLVIGVPNFGSILARLKKDRWQNLIPRQHRWHFTMKTLDALVIPYGFARLGEEHENHDRIMYPMWKRRIYAIIDTIALATGTAEAMLVVYQKL